MAESSSVLMAFLLSTSWVLDIAVGCFFVAAALANFDSIRVATTESYPRITLSLGLTLLGALCAFTGLLRFPVVDFYCRFFHRFAGKALLWIVGAAIVLALEPSGAQTLTWRGIVGIIVSGVAVLYSFISCITIGGLKPRSLIDCGESSKSEEQTPVPRASPFMPAPAPQPSYLLPIPAAAAAQTAQAGRGGSASAFASNSNSKPKVTKPKYGAENPFSAAAAAI